VTRFVKYDSINLWTESFGNKKDNPILLIAGAHAPSTFWPNFFCNNLVKKGFYVIRYDHRDIGLSTHFPKTQNLEKPIYTLKELMEDAIQILDAYKIQKTYVVGHSMGGSIVQYLQAYHPERILKAFSVSVGVNSWTHKHPEFDKAMEDLLKNKPSGDFEKDWPGWLRSWKILHGNIEIDESIARNYTKSIYSRHTGDYEVALNHVAAHKTKEIVTDKLPRSIVLINGTEDVLSPIEEIDKLKSQFIVAHLEGVGHVFFNRKIFANLLQIIINQIRDTNNPLQNQIVLYEDKFEVRVESDTVWLTQKQMSELFDTERSVITKHLKNIFLTKELEEKSNVQKMHIPNSDKPVKFYNLDIIISVGYRVNSKKGTQFRIWATNILKQYLINGFAVNEYKLKNQSEKLNELRNLIKLLSNVTQLDSVSNEAKGIIHIITEYSRALNILDNYDHHTLPVPKGIQKSKFVFTYDKAIKIVRIIRPSTKRYPRSEI